MTSTLVQNTKKTYYFADDTNILYCNKYSKKCWWKVKNINHALKNLST